MEAFIMVMQYPNITCTLEKPDICHLAITFNVALISQTILKAKFNYIH